MAIGVEVARQHAPKSHSYCDARSFARGMDDFVPIQYRGARLGVTRILRIGIFELYSSPLFEAKRLANRFASPTLYRIPLESLVAWAINTGFHSVRSRRKYRCYFSHLLSHAHHAAKSIAVANSE